MVKFIWDTPTIEKGPRFFLWKRVKGENKWPDDVDRWEIIAPTGKNACTVFDNGVWHTWDRRGIGGENSSEPTVGRARGEAFRSVIFQGWHGRGDFRDSDGFLLWRDTAKEGS